MSASAPPSSCAAPTPIFVIGMNRTGTKWLSNLIANHPEVIAVQHERHTGILETNVFDAWPRKFPDLSPPDEYVGFVELWSRTDFFCITGANQKMFYDLSPRPKHILDMFRILMDDFARRNGRRFWLQKVSPWSSRNVLRHFPDARLVVIERDRLETLRSTHQLVTGGREAISLKAIASHHLQQRVLRRLQSRPGVAAVRFEELRRHTRRELERICVELGLAFREGMDQSTYERNTSFRSGESARRRALSTWEIRKIHAAGIPLDLIPDVFLDGMRRLFRSRSSAVVGGTFGQIKAEHDLR